MDFGDISGNIPIIVIIVVFVLLQFFLKRRRKPDITHQEIAQNLLSEVRLNLALAEIFHLRQKPKKFEAVSWQMNKTKLDFLDESLHTALSNAFTTLEDFNWQIDTAKKHKSDSYIINVDVGKIKEPLSKSRQGLETWLQSTTGTKEPSPKYPGIFDDLFGGR